MNLRNYTNLQAQDIPHGRTTNGVPLGPLGVGSGMLGLPGDFSQTVVAAAHLLHNS